MSLLRKIFKLGPPAPCKPALSPSGHEIVVPQMDEKQFVIAAVRENWDVARKLNEAQPGMVITLERRFILSLGSERAKELLKEAMAEASDDAKDENP